MNYLGGNNMIREIISSMYIYDGEEFEFNYYTSLRPTEKVSFIKNVISTIISEEFYYSVIKDLVFDATVITMFTDITLPEDINKIEEFLKETNLAEIVKSNVEYGIIEELKIAVDNNIAYRTGIHKNSVADSFSSLIKTLEEKVSDIDTKSMMEMTQVINGITGELTVDKMLEAYINSDIFKQNQKQIIANKEENDVKINAVVEEIKSGEK